MTSIEPTPAQIDAERIETIDITWDGFAFTVPAQVDDWDVDTLKAFEDNKAMNGVQRILGAEQANALARHIREKYGRAARVKDYGAVMDAVATALGFESAGE